MPAATLKGITSLKGTIGDMNGYIEFNVSNDDSVMVSYAGLYPKFLSKAQALATNTLFLAEQLQPKDKHTEEEIFNIDICIEAQKPHF